MEGVKECCPCLIWPRASRPIWCRPVDCSLLTISRMRICLVSPLRSATHSPRANRWLNTGLMLQTPDATPHSLSLSSRTLTLAFLSLSSLLSLAISCNSALFPHWLCSRSCLLGLDFERGTNLEPVGLSQIEGTHLQMILFPWVLLTSPNKGFVVRRNRPAPNPARRDYLMVIAEAM